jgi:deoxyguanosine kinase
MPPTIPPTIPPTMPPTIPPTMPPTMPPIMISIEGNIGSGKSTLLLKLEKYIRSIPNQEQSIPNQEQSIPNQEQSIPKIIFLPEPVNEWNTIKDKDGVTVLTKFYENQPKYSFAFQMMAYISRLALIKKAVLEYPGAIIITERCLDTDRQVFARMLYDQGKMEEIEYQIYMKWFDTFYTEFTITHHIYLRTTPDIAYERVLKRNRPGESITKAYLETCHTYHDNWLTSPTIVDKVITIDANYNTNHMPYWIQTIKDIIMASK